MSVCLSVCLSVRPGSTTVINKCDVFSKCSTKEVHEYFLLLIVAEPTQHCKDDEFRCGDSDQCVPYSTVCDARYDCTNKMDEPMSCGEFFFVYCICLCRKMENVTHCNTCWRNRVDVCIVNWKFLSVSYNVTGSFISGIDECIDHNGHCQQLCNDTKTSYLCSCHEGFEIDKEDDRVCQGTYLLFKCSSDSFSASIGMSLW